MLFVQYVSSVLMDLYDSYKFYAKKNCVLYFFITSRLLKNATLAYSTSLHSSAGGKPLKSFYGLWLCYIYCFWFHSFFCSLNETSILIETDLRFLGCTGVSSCCICWCSPVWCSLELITRLINCAVSSNMTYDVRYKMTYDVRYNI